MSQVRKFRLLSSFYSERVKGTKKVRKYTKGQIIASRHNLCEKFRMKFEEVDPKTPASVPAQVAGPKPEETSPAVEPPPAEEATEEPVEKEGKDVTDKYELAEKHELTVMKQPDKTYTVYDKESAVVAECGSSDELKDFLAGFGKEKHKGKK
jgi:hypothetical protein